MRRPSLAARPRPLALPPGDGRGEGARRGFTLVELLVVVAILATLMALLVPTVMRARGAAYTAKVKAEADMLHMALMNYKNEFGSFPPADMRGLWNSTGSGQVNTNHAVYRHLIRIFPRMAEQASGAGSPYRDIAQLSPAQALVFWLRGFYPNQQFPLTNGGNPGSRKKFYDFDESRLYAASPYWSLTSPYTAVNSQAFGDRNTFARGSLQREYPVYFTAHSTSGLPYVYFDSRCYDDQTIGDTAYGATSLNGPSSIALPYFSSDAPSNPLWSQRHVSPDTFQIIASGPDGHYGGVAASFPAPHIDSTTTPALNIEAASALREHLDNVTNFASGSLLDATNALKSR